MLAGNSLQETRPGPRTGIRIGPQVGAVELRGNRFAGFSADVADGRGKGG